ncbi:MAG: YjbQ family protein [Magnetococcales bacterium]|nr:YjbQ family protein [Magnetococcales bacterium]MBF0321595.1 YjbQ family protein [Magnetococcales bacterium]
MRHAQTTMTIQTQGVGLLEITREIAQWLQKQGVQTGQITVFCRHTSASLTIQENADPDVLLDLVTFFDRLVPEGTSWFRHASEGPDDMPAHIKTALTQVSITIPVAQGRMVLGTWQGIYLCEHRRQPHRRDVVLHVIGE